MQKSIVLWALAFILILSLFWHLGSWGVTESSEARYAEISREMLETGNWTLPQYLQVLHFDKPLMTYWITALGLKVFGVNAFAVRFFLQIAFLVQLLLVYKISFELFLNKKIASFAVIIYCGLPLVLISIRNLTTDAYLNTFALLATLFYILYYKRQKVKWLYAFFICLGLTIFTKGPICILLPLLMIFPVHQILGSKETVTSKSYHFFIGILISLAIGGWWFFHLIASSPAFYDFFVGQQIIDRVAHAETLKRSKPFWYYIVFLPLLILPMFTLLVESIISFLKDKSNPIKWMVIFTILIPLLLFSFFSSKLILYILPITPYLAILLAYFLYYLEENKVWKHLAFITFIYILIVLAIIGLFFGLLPDIYYSPNFYQFILLGLLLVFALYISFKINNGKYKILLIFLILPLFIVPISTDIMKKFEIEINSTVPITDFIKNNNLDDYQIIVWNRALNSISFQLLKPVYSIRYQHYSLDRITKFQTDDTWKSYLININEGEGEDQFKKLIQSPSVFISLDKIPEQYNWILSSFTEKYQIGKWMVYYNNL
jgi:4-amino-4-deoxy-L-arabinose transferase